MAPSRRLRAVLCSALLAWLWLLSSAARADSLLALRLSSPPHAPDGAPDVVVHVPSHFQRRAPLELLVFLHGFSSCVRALVASEPTPCVAAGDSAGGQELARGAAQRGYGLARIHEQAHTNTLLIVPQLAFLARDASAPRFAQAGGFDAFLRDLRAQLAKYSDPNAPIHAVTLLAHSAGYKAAAAILSDPERTAPVRNVVLLDALYAGWDVFARFLRARDDHRLISLYTRDAKTTRGNRKLAALLGAHRPRDKAQKPWLQRLVQERVDTPHRLVPERHLGPILRGLFQNAP